MCQYKRKYRNPIRVSVLQICRPHCRHSSNQILGPPSFRCNGVNWGVQDNAYIILDAPFLQCTFQYTHETKRGTHWRVVFAHDPEISDALFYPTPRAEEEEDDELFYRLQTELWNAFVLGELVGATFNERGHHLIIYSKTSYLILLVTEERKIDGVAERIGLIYLRMDFNLECLGGIPIKRRTIHLG